ncbi:MAG: hypothetical protein KKG93_09300 [Bacteroidetes bacterium]|nr:hypothetical protein [Bacteroidota bacterium]
MRVLSIIFLCSISIFGQIDTTVWYPLNVGDYWEYQTEEGRSIESRKIISDTLMPSGKTYAKICHYYDNTSGHEYDRVENNSYKYFYDGWSNTEYKFYDFSIPEDEYWDFGRYLHVRFLDYNSITYSQIFGDILKIKRFEEHKFMTDTIGFTYETIAKGIGPIVFGWHTGYDEKDSITLSGAIINGNQYGQITSQSAENLSPKEYSLKQNFPNPFNPATNINFSVPQVSFVTLKIYNLLGEETAIILSEEKQVGSY